MLRQCKSKGHGHAAFNLPFTVQRIYGLAHKVRCINLLYSAVIVQYTDLGGVTVSHMAHGIFHILRTQGICLGQILAVELLALQLFPIHLSIFRQFSPHKAITAVFAGQILHFCNIRNACIVGYLYIRSGGFQQFLADYGFAYAATCDLTPQTGIIGMASTGEFANIVSAVYDYLDSGSAAAAYLKTCMLAADHDILYVPDGVPAAKKYGSWDYAYHDVAIVYAKHPYWIVCMTDQGDENVDFPEEPTQAMQTLGQLVYEYWNP